MQVSGSAPNWRQITLFLLTVAVVLVSLLLLRPFVLAIVGAVVIAVVTERPHLWLVGKTGRSAVSASIALIAVILSIVVPLFFIARNVGVELATLVADLRNESLQQHVTEYFSRHAALAHRIQFITNAIDLENAIQSSIKFAGKNIAILIGNSIQAITQIVVMLFILFFLYRDSDLAKGFARSLLPLEDHEADIFLKRMRDTIYATAMGRFAIAALQGVLAGLAFWLLGVPDAFLWGTLTTVMAMIPAFGAVLVWAPIALYLGLNGSWLKAALLAVWGGGVVSLVDNFLYPIVVGPRLRQHSVTILLSILGGIVLFGIAGIVLGPLTFAAAAVLLDIWRQRGREERL